MVLVATRCTCLPLVQAAQPATGTRVATRRGVATPQTETEFRELSPIGSGGGNMLSAEPVPVKEERLGGQTWLGRGDPDANARRLQQAGGHTCYTVCVCVCATHVGVTHGVFQVTEPLPHSCQLNMFDNYGDGWNLNMWSWIDSSGNTNSTGRYGKP